ncbi:class I SAM-dependent methyltransferase [Sedimentibacter sp. zth1]|uniref:Eco57I restriction-modification methylase domain-containing protein n=1 Tax=Sedimentibacter sp. zth1 TaxID=2816908 RepID=UPI001A91B56C|nr:class I SAM-dependent methyltransferase [Sedimentibacter sp. zth1]QSX04790.1 class I SAM-dependent methyltransferase [Sedimentibacter sp. zth1]
MKLKKDNTEQKLRGAYYTPLQLANAMVDLFAAENISKILEPSCGDGVFLDSMKEKNFLKKVEKFTAIELDTQEAHKVKNKYNKYNKYMNVDIINNDFFDFYNQNYKSLKYDLILGNPPYIRYQYLSEEQRESLSCILTSHGMKSNKLVNVWVGFLVACTQMLNETGRIAFVIPAEILQVAYAEDLRLFLSNQYSRITLITFEKLVFPEIEQEVIVFVGEKGGEEKGIRIVEINDLDDFASLDLHSNGYQKMQHVKEKWTKYFTTSDEIKAIQQIKKDARFASFSSFGTINVGVTTGNNDYFSVDKQTSEIYQLDEVTLPLIGRSSHAHGIYFTKSDWKKNDDNGKKARLVVFPSKPFREYALRHTEYIKLGEDNDADKGYKCSIRDRWYIVPSIWIPDAFFLRRNNLYPKFVLNKCEAISTDTMHRMKLNEEVDAETLLLSYYNSISFAFTEICGRSYGGGVLEILPGEMGNIMLPIVENFPEDKKKELLKKIDNIVRNNENIEDALDLVDNVVLIEFLKFDSDLCKTCRNIWKKLQKRRLGRG